jgi:RimJ/RimL family protein N-acetyltransferase
MFEQTVYLRPLQVEDAKISWRWRNDASLWTYTGSRPNCEITEAMERDWAERVIQDSSRINFAICLSPSNDYIGNIYLVNIHDGVGELGIFIGNKDAHGKGYGTQALKALGELAKTQYNMKKIKIGVNRENKSAMAIYRKCGGIIVDDAPWATLEINL